MYEGVNEKRLPFWNCLWFMKIFESKMKTFCSLFNLKNKILLSWRNNLNSINIRMDVCTPFYVLSLVRGKYFERVKILIFLSLARSHVEQHKSNVLCSKHIQYIHMRFTCVCACFRYRFCRKNMRNFYMFFYMKFLSRSH